FHVTGVQTCALPIYGKNELTNKGGRTPGFRVANPRTDTDTIKFNLDNLPLMFRQGQNGFRHNIPISTSTKLLRFFTLSPSLNFKIGRASCREREEI